MKHLLFIALLISISTIVFGQRKFAIGAEGAAGMIFLNSQNTDVQGHPHYSVPHALDIGFSGGLFFQYDFHKIFSLRTNIAYERKGAKDTNRKILPSGPVGYTARTKFEYLTLPILLKASFGKKTKFFMTAGPYFGYLMKAIDRLEVGSTTFEEDHTDAYKHFDMGFSFGGGTTIPFRERFALSFEMRYNLGIYNVKDGFERPVQHKVQTRSVVFLLGVSYRIGKETKQ